MTMVHPSDSPTRSATRRVVNTRLILILGLGLVIGGTGLFFVWRYQLHSTAGALKTEAVRLRDAGDRESAIRYLRQYLELRPDARDYVDVVAEMAELRHEAAQAALEQTGLDTEQRLGRAVAYLQDSLEKYEEVLRREPARDEARREAVSVCIELFRLTRRPQAIVDARAHLNALSSKSAEDGELQYWEAQCDFGERKFEQARAGFERALTLGYHKVPAYTSLCRVLREHLDSPEPEQADRYIEKLASVLPDDFAAALAVADYRYHYGQHEESIDAVRRVVALAATDPEKQAAARLAALACIANPDAPDEFVEETRQNLISVLNTSPAPQLFLLLSRLEKAAGNGDEALAVLERARTKAPQSSLIASAFAEELLDRGDFAEAEEVVQTGGLLDRLGAPEIDRQFLQGRLFLERTDGQANLREAEHRFERVRTLTVSQDEPTVAEFGHSAQRAAQASLKLGECYRRMGRYEDQLAAYQRALDTLPDSQAALRGKADALVRLGRPDEATEAVKSLVDQKSRALRAIVAQIEQERRRPREDRDWSAVEAALATVLENDPESVDARILQANLALIRNDAATAEQLLRAASAEHPASLSAWLARARLAIQRTDWDEALEVLREAREQTGDSAVLRTALADYWMARGGLEAAEHLNDLAENLDTIPVQQRPALLASLADRRAARNELSEAHALRSRVAALAPQNVQFQFQLYKLAKLLSVNAEGQELAACRESMQAARDRLVAVEGEDGPMVLATRVVELIEPGARESAGTSPADLERARTLLLRVAELRPGWELVPLCRAQIDWLQSQSAPSEQAELLRRSAADSYREAIDSGSRDPRVAMRLTSLLVDQQRWTDLRDCVRVLADSAPELLQQAVRDELLRKFTVLKETAGHDTNANRDAAARLYQVALRTVPPGTMNAADAYFLGQLKLADGQSDAAAKDFVRAIERAPGMADAWTAAVRTLVSQGRAEAAEKIVEAGSPHIPEVLRPQILARCYELLGQKDTAEQQWQAALEQSGNHPAILRNVVMFHSRIDQLEKAETLLRSVLANDSGQTAASAAWARRALATVLAKSRPPRFAEALELLESGQQDENDRLAAQVVKARLLAGRPYRNDRLEAVAILDQVQARKTLDADERLLLAELLDRLGKSERASEVWAGLVNENATNAQLLVPYLRRQIRKGEFRDAERRLAQLTSVAPTSFATIELEVRLKVEQKQPDAAVESLVQFVDLNDVGAVTRVERLQGAAALLEELIAGLAPDDVRRPVLTAAAEPLYQELAQHLPAKRVDLARFLAREGRLDAALELCEEVVRDDSGNSAAATATAVALLHVPGATAEHVRRAERLLSHALQEGHTTLSGLLQLAEVRDLHEQRYDEAIALYRQVVDRSPQHFAALNNLAWLLSMWKQEHAEAAGTIAKALHVAGSMPALLDTQGVVLLNSGATEDAIAKFTEALAQSEFPAANYHLALALLKLDRRDEAAASMQQALNDGLSAADLHPLERNEFERISAALVDP